MTPEPGLAEEIRRYQTEYARNPDGLVFARLADAYRRAGEGRRALELLERGLERHPHYLSGLVVRARTLVDLGRSESAIDAFRRVLELDPRNPVALRALARLARESGRLEEAVAAYRSLCELDPHDDEVRERLAEMERLRARAEPEVPEEPVEPEVPEVPVEPGVPEAAAASTGPEVGEDMASTNEDEDVVVTATMAELFLRQGLYQQAARILERLLERRPGDPLLAERLDTARRLASGETDLRSASEWSTAPNGTDGGGEAAGDGTSESGGEPRPGRRGAAASPGTSPAEGEDDEARGGTIRDYLERLLEGEAEAEAGSGGSRFARWLQDSGDE